MIRARYTSENWRVGETPPPFHCTCKIKLLMTKVGSSAAAAANSGADAAAAASSGLETVLSGLETPLHTEKKIYSRRHQHK